MTNIPINISPKDKIFFAILSILIVPISGLAIDIYTPSLPSVSQYFGVDKTLAQLSITFYMIGVGVMQLFAGSISDSFGRRKPFLVANSIFILTTIAIPFVGDIYQLLILRLTQGIAVALTIVPMRSIVADLYEGRQLAKWMNYMVMAWSIGPIIAPAIGGYLQHFFNWKSSFYFLAIYTIVTGLLVYFYLPETSRHRHQFHLCDIMKRYTTIMLNSKFVSALLINGILYSLMILFGIAGPFLIQSEMHYSSIAFGNVALIVGLAWFLGTMTNKFLLDIPYKKKACICLWTMFVTAILMVLMAYTISMNIYILVLPILLTSTLGGIIFPNNFAKIMALFPTMTGSANALFGGFIFIITSIISALAATYLHSTSLMPISLAYVGLIALCLIIFRFQSE